MKFGVGQSVGRTKDRGNLIGAGCCRVGVNAGVGLLIAFLSSYVHTRLNSYGYRVAETSRG